MRTSTPELVAAIGEANPEDVPALALAVAARLAAVARSSIASPAMASGGDEPRDRLLGMPAVAAYLGIPEDRARDLGRRRELPIVTIGKYRRVRLSALIAYVERHEQKGLDSPANVSDTLSLRHVRRRGATNAETLQADAGRVRRAGGHASHHDLKVGNGRVAGRLAVVSANGAASDDAGTEAEG